MEDQIKIISQWLGSGSINIFGRPFSGKDTQARLLAVLLGAVVIGGGDILRSHDDPEQIEQIMASGGIIPSDFYLNLVLPYLSRPEFKDKPLILSAVGRSSGEEPVIMQATNDSSHPIKAVIHLRITEEEAWKRFEAAKTNRDRGNRSDDQPDVLKTRLSKFQEKTLPVVEFFRAQHLLIEIDGTLSREEVTDEILRSILEKASV